MTTSHLTVFPVGLMVSPDPLPNAPRTAVYPGYAAEILSHAGIPFRPLPLERLCDDLGGVRILVAVGCHDLEPATQEHLSSWVRGGGALIAVSGACGIAREIGVEIEKPAYSPWAGGIATLGEGYLAGDPDHPILCHLRIPLHFFGGMAMRCSGQGAIARVLGAHQSPTERAGIVERVLGAGRVILIAPDVTGTIVRIQQGICVTRDGVPAPDGTATRSDGVLKSDDGAVLDWDFDRQPVEGVAGFRAFLEPVADLWREVLIRAVLHLAREQGVPLPVLWMYPNGAEAIAHLSHDSDLNDPEDARHLLEVLHGEAVRSTWCIVTPGYARDVLGELRAAGHELAMHYDAMSEGRDWSEEEFHAQFVELQNLFDGDAPAVNKNHYLRWEGDTAFFDWCVAHGIRLDESKGASKTGEAGFNFGTCHPYFPVRWGGALIDVLELATPTQDIGVFAPPELLPPLLAAVVRCHGVLHLLSHPAHVRKPGVAEALVRALRTVRDAGLEWWTAQEIDRWERARRGFTWDRYEASGSGVKIGFTAGDAMRGATILWLGDRLAAAAANGAPVSSRRLTRWGFEFLSVELDAGAGESVTMEVGT